MHTKKNAKALNLAAKNDISHIQKLSQLVNE